ncbi:MAG: alpha/beta hydrolase, partial [Burkholderiaceae bacterium]|nr:alpha/beta hydrolase [Burkholderiaceae bacterium]
MRLSTDLKVRHATVAGQSHHYIDEGVGPALVLIHGSLCDCRYWDAQIKALRAHFRVIAPSLEHYWPAQWDGQGNGFTVASHARGVIALLRHLGIERAHWVGHSRGGRVALEAALSDVASLASLSLADPGVVFADERDRPVTRERDDDRAGERCAGLSSSRGAADSASSSIDQRDDFREVAARHIAQGRVDEGLAVFVDTVTGPQTWQRMVPWFKAMAHDNASTVLGQIREATVAVDPQALHALTLPCLLIGGGLSPAPYPGILSRLHAELPDSELHMIAGSSHGMNIGNPRAFNRCIEQFLLGE